MATEHAISPMQQIVSYTNVSTRDPHKTEADAKKKALLSEHLGKTLKLLMILPVLRKESTLVT